MAAAGEQQVPLLENAAGACEASSAGATVMTTAPAPATSMTQAMHGSKEAGPEAMYGTGIVQHGAIEELLQHKAGLMIRERLFAPRMQHASRALPIWSSFLKGADSIFQALSEPAAVWRLRETDPVQGERLGLGCAGRAR